MNIYIGGPVEYNDYSAMQGPCAEGFHVPLKSEWVDIKTVWTALGGGSSDGTNFSATLKIPMSGFRRYDNTVRSVGEGVLYWSSTYYDSSEAYYFFITSSTLSPQNTNYRSNGYSIRCIKDTPVTPTASWTKLYGTSIEAGGIFWSSTDGLISMSSNGNTWITIADKNLGATTVWNSGDTLTDANCGKVYQWGNNYGFPGTKSSSSISTSSSQVNVTGYGPGNYYSSSTWITTVPRNNSSNNGNDLWGGVTGVQQKTKSTEVQNIYIGDYTGWHPGANTLCYFPLSTDAVDTQGYRTLTLKQCSVTDGALVLTSNTSSAELNSGIGGSVITISVWYNCSQLNSGGWDTLLCRSGGTAHHLLINGGGGGGTVGTVGFYINGFYPSSAVITTGTWNNYIVVKSGSNEKIYFNGNLVLDSNSSFDNSTYNFGIIGNNNSGSNGTQGCIGKISALIVENSLWSADEVLAYYNGTKSKYGIS